MSLTTAPRGQAAPQSTQQVLAENARLKADLGKAKAQSRAWQDRALRAEKHNTLIAQVLSNSNLTESERVRSIATLNTLHSEASKGPTEDFNRHNHGDVVRYAGIATTPTDDSEEARERAWNNARKTAGKALAHVADLGLAETKIIPDGMGKSSTLAKPICQDILSSLAALAKAGEPRKAKKSRGKHVALPTCPECGSSDVRLTCKTCGSIHDADGSQEAGGRQVQSLHLSNKPLPLPSSSLPSSESDEQVLILHPSSMLEEALALAARGIPVFPCHTPTPDGCSCSRPDCKDVGKHPRITGWQAAQTTDPKQIQEWWTKWPTANIGSCYGIVIDPDAEGMASWGDAVRHHPELSDTLIARTGGGGLHVFFQAPDDMEIGNRDTNLPNGVNVRGQKGFVILAPSLHVSGKRYEWANNLPVAPLPSVLRAWLAPSKKAAVPLAPRKVVARSYSTSYSGGFITTGNPIPEGKRNDTLYRTACAMRGKAGMDEDTMIELLQEVNINRCHPPLDDSEVEKIARSAAIHSVNA